jgi:hypothetical protein
MVTVQHHVLSRRRTTATRWFSVGVGPHLPIVAATEGDRQSPARSIHPFEPNRRLAAQSHSGFFKLAEPLMLRMGRRQLQSDLDNLKDLMEANAL